MGTEETCCAIFAAFSSSSTWKSVPSSGDAPSKEAAKNAFSTKHLPSRGEGGKRTLHSLHFPTLPLSVFPSDCPSCYLPPPLSPFKEGQSPEYKCKLRGREERKKETSLEVVCRSGVDGQSVRRKKGGSGSCHTRSCVYTREKGGKDIAGGEP